jgi:hypothetical protein
MQRWLIVMIALGASSFACSSDDSSSNGTGAAGRAGSSSGGSAGATGGTGTGGGAGAGGQGGGPATDGGDACTQCRQTKCATEIQACEADPPCKAARACLAACAPDDGACKVACLDPQRLPVGNAAFTNMSTCYGDQCSTECM